MGVLALSSAQTSFVICFFRIILMKTDDCGNSREDNAGTPLTLLAKRDCLLEAGRC